MGLRRPFPSDLFGYFGACVWVCVIITFVIIIFIFWAITVSWLLLPLPLFCGPCSMQNPNALLRPKSEPATDLIILLLGIKAHVPPGAPGVLHPLAPDSSQTPLAPPLPLHPLFSCFLHVLSLLPGYVLPPQGAPLVAGLVSSLPCLGHVYTKKLFTSTWNSDSPRHQVLVLLVTPTAYSLSFFRSLLTRHLLVKASSGLSVSTSNSPALSQSLLHVIFMFGVHHHPSDCMFCAVFSCAVMSDSWRARGLWPAGLLCPWDSAGENTGTGSHFFLQGIFPTQGLSPISCIGRWMLHHCTTWEAHQTTFLSIFCLPHSTEGSLGLCPSALTAKSKLSNNADGCDYCM